MMAKKIDVKLLLELRQANMSQRAIASTRHISTKSVAAVWRRADELGISLADVTDKTSDEVYTLFFPEKFRKETMYASVDYEYVHNELKKSGVTLKLLWQEHKDDSKGGVPVGYTKFCDDYAKYVEQNNLTNHITHKPGVVCEVDWSGKTMRLHATDEDKVYPVYLFVATLPYSQLAYVEPCLNMNEQSWINCNIHMFEYFGGVTLRIVCDNLKTGVISHPREGDIILNQCYEDFSNHYCTAIMPAGVKKPKHKPSVEGTVGKIATAIIARLRNNVYTSICDLKANVAAALEDFNNKPFQKREGSRREIFEASERITLRPLPAFPYEYAVWEYGRVIGADFHVTYLTNKYSVPYRFVGKQVDLKVTDSMIEIYCGHERISSHKRFPSYVRNRYDTYPEDIPERFQRTEWNEHNIRQWAASIGKQTLEVIDRIFKSCLTSEKGINPALSVLKLSKKYSAERLETACTMALEHVSVPRYSHLRAILSAGKDEDYKPVKQQENEPAPTGFLRGAAYYGGDDHAE